MPIDFEIDRTKDFTTFTFRGEVKLSEMIGTMNSYGKSGITLNELYDLRQVRGERITIEDIDVTVSYFRQYGGVRPLDSKTAVLVDKSLDDGISRTIQNLIEDEVPFKIKIFQSLEEALVWLQVPTSQKT